MVCPKDQWSGLSSSWSTSTTWQQESPPWHASLQTAWSFIVSSQPQRTMTLCKLTSRGQKSGKRGRTCVSTPASAVSWPWAANRLPVVTSISSTTKCWRMSLPWSTLASHYSTVPSSTRTSTRLWPRPTGHWAFSKVTLGSGNPTSRYKPTSPLCAPSSSTHALCGTLQHRKTSTD